MKDEDLQLVKIHLLSDRDREVRKVLGFGKREITSQIIQDLYFLPGSGGSDERRLAHEWLERSIAIFPSYEIWTKRARVFGGFEVPTILEMEALAFDLRARQAARSR